MDKSLRLSAFIDAGRSSRPTRSWRPANCAIRRRRAGLDSPFGPLRLSLAQPLNSKSGFDRIERLQFTFGTAF
jgi:outer membrane protein assembly factor BamA